jgi:hypothetical protein
MAEADAEQREGKRKEHGRKAGEHVELGVLQSAP